MTPEPIEGLRPSEVESRRFGLRVYRGSFTELPGKQLLPHFVAERIDVAILRLPADRADQLARIDQAGLPYAAADTLVYYAIDLTRHEIPPPRNPELTFVPCTAAHHPVLDRLVAEIFATYRNHYSANPLLARDLLPGYQEWTRAYAGDEGTGRRAWLVERGGEPIGFATCSFAGAECEGVLYGVRPSAAGGGVYGDIIRFTQRFFKQAGFTQMKVSTQVHNAAVQKVWAREGFHLERALLTVHVNSLLAHTARPPLELPLCVTSEMLTRFGETSGDLNPMHFDDAYAQRFGMRRRIAHGLVANAAISRAYGMEYPGPGTLFADYRYKFLRPLYLERDYRVILTFPVADEQRGVFLSVARVVDPEGDLCLLGYNQLRRRPVGA